MTSSDEVRWGLAGFYSEEYPGRLERPLDPRFRGVPARLRLDGDLLRWDWREGDEGLDDEKWIRPGPGVILQFLELADAKPDAVLNYARRWGILSLCHCTRPSAHGAVFRDVPGGLPPCDGRSIGDPFDNSNAFEDLDVWFRYARRARAILRSVAAAAHDQTDIEAWSDLLLSADGDRDLELWRHCSQDHIDECEPAIGRRYPSSGACRATRHLWCECRTPRCYLPGLRDFEVGIVIDNLLADTEVRTRCSWLVGHKPELLIGPDEGLLGEIALQLALVSTRSSAIAFCSYCARPYAPKRRPAPNRNNYCPGCRDRGRWADAQRRRRSAPS